MRKIRLTPSHITALKTVIHAVSLFYVALLVLQTLQGQFGADPVQGLSHFTGKAALNTLFITLMVSPIAKWWKQGSLVKVRRVLGLYSFFWAVLHLLVYILLDLNLDWALLASEIAERPYLTVGAVCWLILCALAVTSTQKIQRKLGKRWQQLHNWVYLAVLLAPVHYFWSVKSGVTEPALYLFGALILLSFRKKTLLRWVPKSFRQISSES
ncbi:protein-methionine-sulfoxide reductase heme-binding subunit MsrQ [Photobacterium sp. 1_MG-2023]|uniref:protein-methionine-sulfoxide reductase heme-binding subunit MsrQ n=1 Tax=Photobacterium sp. 1_MG-2023 TaxID=3062646 RepID=UPI0026E3406F|nr:protein-methionine-sulfoxide reductase heme-binding subunit MsrQ [Photobacterium sp. 1_MG-2023]MDO6706681.1 protein-methionine-sulfoxide reductase heme-binding subunit MsrQ [Photobacterium sp. 1_MG-2023]